MDKSKLVLSDSVQLQDVNPKDVALATCTQIYFESLRVEVDSQYIASLASHLYYIIKGL